MQTLRLLGVPLRSGSQYPGTENDATGYRDAGLIDRLRKAGIAVHDEGDLEVPSYLPHHRIPPIRNWPGPRIVWDLVEQRVDPFLQNPQDLPVLLGCDCSIVVGTAAALRKRGDLHVVYIDGDFDDAPPDHTTVRSGAAIATWLLTNNSPFCAASVPPENVTVIGWTKGPFTGSSKIASVPINEVRGRAAGERARRLLAGIPQTTNILVHFDIDVIQDSALPAAYFPHAEGLTLDETGAILDAVLADPRVRLIEISEYTILRDPDRQHAATISSLLVHALQQRGR